MSPAFLCIVLLGPHSLPQHLPPPILSLSFSLSHWIFETIWGFARLTKHLFLDCTKGRWRDLISSKKTSSRRRVRLSLTSWCTKWINSLICFLFLTEFYFECFFCILNSCLIFLVYILVISLCFFIVFFNIVVYMKISFGHRKAIFLVEASCR